jgi:hypothetical protein
VLAHPELTADSRVPEFFLSNCDSRLPNACSLHLHRQLLPQPDGRGLRSQNTAATGQSLTGVSISGGRS